MGGPGSTLGRRPGRLEAAVTGRGDRLGPPLLVVFPDDWPAADLAAHEAGDAATLATVVELHAGVRPGPATAVIAFRVRPTGPA